MIEEADLEFFANPEIVALLMKINEEFSKLESASPFKDLDYKNINSLKATVQSINTIIDEINNKGIDSSSVQDLVNDLKLLKDTYRDVELEISHRVDIGGVDFGDFNGEYRNFGDVLGVDISNIISEALKNHSYSSSEPTPFMEGLSRQLKLMGAGQKQATIDMMSEDNDDWLTRNDGSGLLIVLEGLKKDFEEIRYLFPNAKNVFEELDVSGDISPNSKNVEIINNLFSGQVNDLITMLYKKLPRVEGNRGRVDWDKISELKENGDPLYKAYTNLHYILGIINSVKRGESLQYSADSYFTKYGNRMPLSEEQYKYAYGRAPKPDTDTVIIDGTLGIISKGGNARISGGKNGLRAYGYPYDDLSKDPDYQSRLKKGQLYGEPIFESSSKPNSNSTINSTEILLKLLNSLEKGNVLYEMLTQELQKEVDKWTNKDLKRIEGDGDWEKEGVVMDIPYKEITPENYYDDMVDNLKLALHYDDIEKALSIYKSLDASDGVRRVGQPNSPKELLEGIMGKYGIKNYKTEDAQLGAGFLKEIEGIKVNTIDEAIKAIESKYGAININNDANIAEASKIGDLIRALHEEYGGRGTSFELGEGNIDWSLYLPQLNNLLEKLIGNLSKGFSEEELDSSIDSLKKQLRSTPKDNSTVVSSKSSNCCDQLIKMLGEINSKINKVGESIAKALEGHVYVFGKKENKVNGQSVEEYLEDNRKKVAKQNSEKIDYKKRVEELEHLSESGNEKVRIFAENALPTARNINNRGYIGEIRDQDLIMGEFGELPDMINMSLGEKQRHKSTLESLKKQLDNLSDIPRDVLKKEIDKTIEEFEVARTGLREGKPVKEGINLTKANNLIERKKQLEGELKKEYLTSDELELLNLRIRAYEALLRGAVPYQNYEKLLNKYITKVGNGTNVRYLENEILKVGDELEKMGVDISSVVGRVIERISKRLFIYRRALKQDISIEEKGDIEDKIEKLESLRNYLGGGKYTPPQFGKEASEGIITPMNISSYYTGGLLPPMPGRMAQAYQRYDVASVPSMYSYPNLLGDIDASGHGLYPSQKVQLLSDVFKRVREEIQQLQPQFRLYTKVSEVPEETLERYNSLQERIRNVHDALYSLKGISPVLDGIIDETIKGYGKLTISAENLIKKNEELTNKSKVSLTKIASKNRKALDALFSGVTNPSSRDFGVKGTESAFANYANLDLDKFRNWEKFQKPTFGFGVGNNLSIDTSTIEEGLDKLSKRREALFKSFNLAIKLGNLENAEEVLESLKEVDSAIKVMFPGDSRKINIEILGDRLTRVNEVSAQTKDMGKQMNRTGSDISQFTRKIGNATSNANGLQGALTQLFSIVGTGRVMDDMITASSLRQTNQIMLASRRGQEEASKLYDKIQMLVVKLPGNDTFLTNILTMLGTMDKSLSGSDLEYMGGVIADYYMGAQAKGQFNNETERELRNYLMTGQTRNFTNSIIASEIESLKGLNTVKERTMALEKALQKTGMDSIAHYDSYHNTLEEFKGRFQKSFADLGDLFLGFLQILMKVYNFIDSISGSFLSQITIVLGVVAMGAVTATIFLGQLADSVGSLVSAYNKADEFLFNPGKLDKYSEAIRNSIFWLGAKLGFLNANTIAEGIHAESITASTIATDAGTIAYDANTMTLGIHTVALNENTTFENTNTLAKIKNFAQNLRESAVRFLNADVTAGEAYVTWMETEAEEGNLIASALVTFQKWTEAFSREMNALATAMEEGALVLYLKTKYSEFIITIKQTIQNAVEIAQKIIRIGLHIAEATALYVLAGAWVVLDAIVTVATGGLNKVIAGIILGVIVLIASVYQLGESFGWWKDIGSMIGAVVAGLGRIWDAFMNSEQVQYAMYIIGGFFENVQALFGSLSALGGIWEMIFGTHSGAGDWDIVDGIINFLGAIGNALWILSPLDEILEIIRAIGAYIGWVLRQWNAFVDTSEYQELIDGFREIRVAIGEIWTEIAPVFDELGKAWAELWGDEKGAGKLKEDGNELLELFKAIAHFIRDYVVPFIKLLVPLIKATLTPLVVTLRVITKIIEGAKWVIDHLPDWMLPDEAKSKPITSYNDQIHQTQQQNNIRLYARGKELAKSWSGGNNNSTIINNNFGEGSVQTNAHNMTEKEVRQLFTSAFGYNKANGVKGVLR